MNINKTGFLRWFSKISVSLGQSSFSIGRVKEKEVESDYIKEFYILLF